MWQFRKACRARKRLKLKKEFLKIANMRSSRRNQHKVCTLNNPIKILNTNKCNMQRINTSEKRFSFVCGDIELNPGPVNISSMSVLTTRLARIGRKPVNIIGGGNCFRPRLHDSGMKLCRLKTITFSTIHTVPVELYLLQLLFISLLKFTR